MLGWIETTLLGMAGFLVIAATLRNLRVYRGLLWGSSAMVLITAVYPRPGNALAALLGLHPSTPPQLTSEVFGIAWWLLAAWIIKGVLNHILRHTIFPNDNRPHSRRLFADLATGFIYVAAFIGIMNTVLDQPIYTVLATSGVAAIVLGLALQSTLADVFSGLALNIERPFKAGDWITVAGGIEGQVIEINWRATRIKTLANDMIVIPNSILAKTAITNHQKLIEARFCTIDLKVDHTILPARVVDVLARAATGASGTLLGVEALAYAVDIADSSVCYQLSFAVKDFSQTAAARSEVISRVAQALQQACIPLGSPITEVRIIRDESTTPKPPRLAAVQ